MLGVPAGSDAGYFRVLSRYGVLLCTGCGACYVGGKYSGHLVSVHGVKGRRKRAMVEGLAGADLAARVVHRPYGQTRMDGLGVHDDWSCKVGGCTAVSTNGDVIRQHCSRAHRLKVKAEGMVSRARL
jgi:hypothetical protein